MKNIANAKIKTMMKTIQNIFISRSRSRSAKNKAIPINIAKYHLNVRMNAQVV